MITHRIASGGTLKAVAIAGNAMFTIESSETSRAPDAAIHRVMPEPPTDGGSDHAGSAGAFGDLPGACQMRHVHHLPLPGKRAGAAARVLLERADQSHGLLGIIPRRREFLVDHLDLPRMNRDLARESHGDAFAALAS